MEQPHLSALEAKHAGLEAKIEQENLRPHPDDTLIAQMKKEKLRLKDEIASH